MFVTRLTDSEERVITAGRGGARGGEQGLFSPATRSSRSILGWVVSFIRRWISRACMAAHRVTLARTNLQIYSSTFFLFRANVKFLETNFIYILKVPRENLLLLENIPSKRIKDYETSDREKGEEERKRKKQNLLKSLEFLRD